MISRPRRRAARSLRIPAYVLLLTAAVAPARAQRPALDVPRLPVVRDSLATGVMAYQGSNEDVGELYVDATPRPDVAITDIERPVDSVVAQLTAVPPTDQELQRVRNYLSVGLVSGLQSSLTRADLLADGQTFLGDPLHYVADAQAIRAVTPADIQRVVRRYLTSGRVVLSMIPAGKLGLVSKPELPYVNVSPAPATAAASTGDGR